jgi:hypothetical protein
MSLVENERIKLTATALNNMATAVMVTGAVAPLIAAFYGVGTGMAHGLPLLASAVLWIGAGAGIHLLARRFLGGLK